MYYYALIDSASGICYMIEQHEEPFENPYYIQISSYDAITPYRQKYINGSWIDTTPEEASKDDLKYYKIDNEWADDKIDSISNQISNHSHSNYATKSNLNSLQNAIYSDAAILQDMIIGKADINHYHTDYAELSHNHNGVYANENHSHTASAVGAIATGDVATVSEVETYLGI